MIEYFIERPFKAHRQEISSEFEVISRVHVLFYEHAIPSVAVMIVFAVVVSVALAVDVDSVVDPKAILDQPVNDVSRALFCFCLEI